MPQEPLRTVTGTSDTSARKVLVVYTQHPAAMLRKSVALQVWPYSGAGVVNVGDTFTVGSITYTFVSSFTAPNQILLSPIGAQNMRNLVSAINGTGVGTGHTSEGTEKHPDVRAYYCYIGGQQSILIASETAGTEYLYSYSSGVESILTPLDEGAWVTRDSAQHQYDNYYKKLGLTKDEWDGVERYGLPILAELFFGDKHPMEVVHVGLNEGVVTPYEVSSEDAYGKYVSVESKTVYGIVGINLENAEGWDVWAGGGFDYSEQGYYRVKDDLVKALASSGYLAAQLDAEGIYDRNISGCFDFIVLATPQAYAYAAHLTHGPAQAAHALFDDPITIGEREYEGASWQCGGWDETAPHLHEYMHFAYRILGGAPSPLGDTLYGEALRDWVGSRDIISGFAAPYMLDRVTLTIPDTYIKFDECDEPWGSHPCQDNHNYNSSLRTGVLHPLMAASFGLTDLSRVITESGRYEIKNMTDAFDVLCIQSPKDPRQVMMLNVYSPREINGGTGYYGAGEIYRGVYATIFRRSTSLEAPTYGNFGASSPNVVVTNYMTDTMIEYYGYGDIGTQESRYAHNAPGVPLPNAKAVLIANPPSVFCGLHQECEGFGVKVEFVEWGEVDGVVAAVVDVTFLDEPVIPETPIPEDDLTDISAKITWSEVLGEVYDLQVDTADTFEYIKYASTFREWNALTGSSFTIPDLLPNTLYYVRMRCHNGTEFSAWSEPISFTTPLPPQLVIPAPSINDEEMTDTTALVEWEYIEGTLCDIECDTKDDFSGVYPEHRFYYGRSLGSYTITGLTRGTTYYLRMRRTYGTFWTAWSEPISFTTLVNFWHIDNDANGALVGEVEVPSGIKKIDVTLTWDGHDPISYTHNCSPGAVQTIVIPAIYPGERVWASYSHLLGTSTGYVDVPEISVKEASVSQQVKLGGNEVVTIESADGLAMCYLCHYNGGVYALVVKDGVGVIYDNLTEPNGFDPLTTESAYKPFLCPDGTPFGAHISIARWLPTTDQPAVMCKICLRRT